MYTSERAARRNAHQKHPQEHFDFYQCFGGYWHYGHDRRKFLPVETEGLTRTAVHQIHDMARRTREQSERRDSGSPDGADPVPGVRQDRPVQMRPS
jgi:hypothetical protein